MSNTLFPIVDAENYLRSVSSQLERDGNVLRWPSHDGITELRVDALNFKTRDGFVVQEEVTLTHSSPALAAVDTKAAASMNTRSTLSALIPGDAETPARLVQPTRLMAKVGIFSIDRAAAERVYAPLICSEASIIGWHAARLSRGELRADPKKSSPLTNTDQLPPFHSADFEAAKDVTDRRGFLGSLGEHHFTVEFPWDPGATSNLFASGDLRENAAKAYGLSDEKLDRMGGKTSLLQLQFGDHPLYGSGVMSLLEIPLPLSTETPALVCELNRWELSTPDLPPFFGAWCAGKRSPAFVTFIPRQFCFPGLLVSLTHWARIRQGMVRQWLMPQGQRKRREPTGIGQDPGASTFNSGFIGEKRAA